MPARYAVVLLAIALAGCIPNLSDWSLVEPGQDGGPPPGQDAGSGTPNPIELGVPCPNPHLLVGMISGSGTTARVLRVDPTTRTACRSSPILELQRAFGSRIADVDWHPDTGAILGLDEAVLALDAEGFPAWRHDPFGYGGVGGDWVAVFGSGASARVAVAWTDGSSSLETLRLLDARGFPTSADISLPSGRDVIAAHPDGSGRILLAPRYGVDVEVYTVGDATTALTTASASQLWTGAIDLEAGYRYHLASDPSTQRLVITHAEGIVFWQVGGPAPNTVISCPSYCSSFHAAAPDPNATGAAYALCSDAGSSGKRHLVHLAGTCTLVVDGTSVGTHTMQDIALVRAAL